MEGSRMHLCEVAVGSVVTQPATSLPYLQQKPLGPHLSGQGPCQHGPQQASPAFCSPGCCSVGGYWNVVGLQSVGPVRHGPPAP